jgi:hypothetical protein
VRAPNHVFNRYYDIKWYCVPIYPCVRTYIDLLYRIFFGQYVTKLADMCVIFLKKYQTCDCTPEGGGAMRQARFMYL